MTALEKLEKAKELHSSIAAMKKRVEILLVGQEEIGNMSESSLNVYQYSGKAIKYWIVNGIKHEVRNINDRIKQLEADFEKLMGESPQK